MPRSFRRVLTPAIQLLDRSPRMPPDAPTAAQEGTRFPGFPWDLRTIIAVFPPQAPFRFLNLNLTLGLTGTPFDRTEHLHGLKQRQAFDLQFCLEGRDGAVTYKRYHAIPRELRYESGAVDIELGTRLRFHGQWPHYRIAYAQPEEDLRLDLRLESWPGLHWWTRVSWLYSHYTSFASCELDWSWRGRAGTLTVPVLHDHGWGRTLLPLQAPLRFFRYEVLRLPEECFPEGGFVASLWTEGPGGLELLNVGLMRSGSGAATVKGRYECRVLEWDRFENDAGHARRVPRRWIGTLRSDAGMLFSHEAVRTTEPRAVIGDGFLCGFEYRIETVGGAPGAGATGHGYVEQFGAAFASST